MFDFIEYAKAGLSQAKWAFTTRRVNAGEVKGFNACVEEAKAGDLVLARIASIGHHTKIQLTSGRPSRSYLDDWVVLVCGNRYAPDQFEGVARVDTESADLLAGGGLIGHMRVAHDRIVDCTKLKPVALLTNAHNTVINIADYAMPVDQSKVTIPVFLVVGSSMNAGKTTAAASLMHGFKRAGFKVAGIKATGTGAYGDFNMFVDAGADWVMDFTDMGMGSTYMQSTSDLEIVFQSLLASAQNQGAEIAVVELADGIYQRETAALLRSDMLRRQVQSVLFATADAISAVGGAKHLMELGFETKAISGKISCSPLATAEVESQVSVGVCSRQMLCDEEIALSFLGKTANQRSAA